MVIRFKNPNCLPNPFREKPIAFRLFPIFFQLLSETPNCPEMLRWGLYPSLFIRNFAMSEVRNSGAERTNKLNQ